MTSVLRRLRGASATPGCAVGSLSAILDLEPETDGEDDYAEVGRKRASRQLSGLVTGRRHLASNTTATASAFVGTNPTDEPMAFVMFTANFALNPWFSRRLVNRPPKRARWT